MQIHVYYYVRNYYTGIILHYINIFNFYVTFKCFEHHQQHQICYVITISFSRVFIILKIFIIADNTLTHA